MRCVFHRKASHVLPAARAIKATQDPVLSSKAQLSSYLSRCPKVLANASPSTATPKIQEIQAWPTSALSSKAQIKFTSRDRLNPSFSTRNHRSRITSWYQWLLICMMRLSKNSIDIIVNQMKHLGTLEEVQVIKRAIWISISQHLKSKRRWSMTSMRGLISDENFCLNKDIESPGEANNG